MLNTFDAIEMGDVEVAFMQSEPRRKKLINFDNKTFCLQTNSRNGTSNSDTVFHYQQNANIVTAKFGGGNVICGTIIALHRGDHLDMIYQMLTATDELKSGKAVAKIVSTANEKIQLELDWEWLTDSGNKGTSVYLEQ